jgi:hypothetical protein
VGESSTKATATRSDDGGLGSRPDESRYGLGSFLFLKINFLVPINISSRQAYLMSVHSRQHKKINDFLSHKNIGFNTGIKDD